MRIIRVRFAARSASLRHGGLDGLLDMFRYSSSFPYSWEDASTIGRAARNEGPKEISFQVAKVTEAKAKGGNAEAIAESAFAFDRWESFGFVPMEVDGIPTQKQIGKATKAAYGG